MDIDFLQQHDVKQFILTPTCKYDFNQLGDWLCSQPIGKGDFRVFVPIKGMKINRLLPQCYVWAFKVGFKVALANKRM